MRQDRRAGQVAAILAAAAALLAVCPASAAAPPRAASADALIATAGRGPYVPVHASLHGELGWREGAWLLRSHRTGLPVVEIPNPRSMKVVALLADGEVVENANKRSVGYTPLAWLDVRLPDGRRGWVLATDERGVPLVSELPGRGRPAPATPRPVPTPAGDERLARLAPYDGSPSDRFGWSSIPAPDAADATATPPEQDSAASMRQRGGDVARSTLVARDHDHHPSERRETSPASGARGWLVFAALVAGFAGGLKIARRRVWLSRDEDPLAPKSEKTLVRWSDMSCMPGMTDSTLWPRTTPVTAAPVPPTAPARPRPAPPRPASRRVAHPPRSLEQALAAISDDLVRTTLVRLVRANFDADAAEPFLVALDRYFRTNFDAEDRQAAFCQLHAVLVSLAGTEGADAYRKLESICRAATEPRLQASVEAPTFAAPPLPRAHGVH